MKKITDLNSDTAFPKEAFDPEELINENVQLADYLNAMLKSRQPINPDLGAINYLYESKEEEAKSSQKVKYYGAEGAKIEANYLRAENSNLRLKIAHLTAKLNEAECRLDSVLTQNEDLASRVDDLQSELARSRPIRAIPEPVPPKTAAFLVHKITEQETRPEPPPPPVVQPVLQEEPAPEPLVELSAFSQQTDEAFVQDPIETPEPIIEETLPPAEEVLEPCPAAGDELEGEPEEEVPKPQIAVLFEEAYREVPEPEAAVSTPAREAAAGAGSGPERWANERTSQAPPPDPVRVHESPVIFSNKRFVFEESIPRARPTSKIIKRKEVVRNQDSEALNPPRAQQNRPAPEITPQPAPVRERQATDLPVTQEPDQFACGDLRQAAIVEGTNEETAPDTKVVARHHIDIYRELQQEADSIKSAKNTTD